MGFKTNTEFLFYLLQLFNQMRTTFGFSLPETLSSIAQFFACLERLNEVLHTKEVKAVTRQEVVKPFVLLKEVTFEMEDKELLRKICLNVTKPGLSILVGPIGSGKTSLLKIILQEYQPLKNGNL